MIHAVPADKPLEDSFDVLVVEQVRRAPWFSLSLALHVLVLLLGRLLATDDSRTPPQAELQIAMEIAATEVTPPDPPDPEVVPVTDEVDPLEVTETDEVDMASDELESPADPGEAESEWERTSVPTNSNPLPSIGMEGGLPSGGEPGNGLGPSRRPRGPRTATRRAVEKGLAWLARHQSPDGSWDTDGFNCDPIEGACKGQARCRDGAAGRGLHDVGVSGLALLAFLGAGETSTFGQYRSNVRAGLHWLKDRQDAEGCFGSRADKRHAYGHAIATLAMTEAFHYARTPHFREAAQRGIDYISQCQNPYSAWRYGEAPGDNDTSVTGWMVMALRSARLAGLSVSDDSLAWALSFIESVTDSETGRTGYMKPGELPVREAGLVDAFPATESESMTAVGVLCRIFLGQDPKTTAAVRAGAEVMERKLPVWDRARGTIDEYYWYYGTLAMYQVGGRSFEAWNKAMHAAIVDTQVTEGESAGSWEPIGAWGSEGGRVYSTAMLTLCLEVYYRYGRVFGTK